MIKAVMFDLDQTLIDSKDAHLAAMVDGLERVGWQTKIEWIYGLTADEILRHNFPNMPEEIVQKIVEHKRRVLKNYLNKIKILPGATKLLNFLKSNGIKLILITNNTHKEANELLSAIGLQGYFDIIVGKEDAEPKPSPHPLIKAIEQVHFPLEQIIYIGDSDTDIDAAKAAGVQIIINTQCHDTATEKYKADWVVANLNEALKILRELIK